MYNNVIRAEIIELHACQPHVRVRGRRHSPHPVETALRSLPVHAKLRNLRHPEKEGARQIPRPSLTRRTSLMKMKINPIKYIFVAGK